MAEKPSTTPKQDSKTKDEATNAGTPSTEAYASADLAVAEAAGITEGEVKALRDDAGVNQSAGHESDIHAWSVSEAGKQFAKDESERAKKYKAEEKSVADQTNKDGLNEAEVKYAEAVAKA